MKKTKTTKKVTPKKKNTVSRPAAKKVPVVMTGADLAVEILKPIEPTFIPELGCSIVIKPLSWPAMLELQQKHQDGVDVDCVLLAHALEISEKDVKAIREMNGRKYAALLGAVNLVYGATNDDVKKP